MANEDATLSLYEKCLSKIRTLLLEEWDPASVKTEKGLEKEYDTYASGVVGILINGGNSKQVATYMAEVDRKQFGGNANAEAFSELEKKAMKIFASEKDKA